MSRRPVTKFYGPVRKTFKTREVTRSDQNDTFGLRQPPVPVTCSENLKLYEALPEILVSISFSYYISKNVSYQRPSKLGRS